MCSSDLLHFLDSRGSVGAVGGVSRGDRAARGARLSGKNRYATLRRRPSWLPRACEGCWQTTDRHFGTPTTTWEPLGKQGWRLAERLSERSGDMEAWSTDYNRTGKKKINYLSPSALGRVDIVVLIRIACNSKINSHMDEVSSHYFFSIFFNYVFDLREPLQVFKIVNNVDFFLKLYLVSMHYVKKKCITFTHKILIVYSLEAFDL